jgi:hypothetical protein
MVYPSLLPSILRWDRSARRSACNLAAIVLSAIGLMSVCPIAE